VRRLLGPALDQFGLDKRPGEDEAVSLVRPSLYAWLGDEGRDERVLAHASQLARSFLNDRRSIDPSLITQVLKLSAIRGDVALFETYRQKFEAAVVPADRERFLGALGNFRDPELRRRALDYNLKGPLRPQEYYVIPDQIGATPSQRDEAWQWWEGHYDEVVAKMPPEYAMFIPLGAHGCSQKRIDSAQAFFANSAKQKPGTLTTLAKVVEGTRDCIGLRTREGAAVDRFLAQHAGASGTAAGLRR
jgi:hypothetical protein